MASKKSGTGYARTTREPFSRLIGYDFGGMIYDGKYWDEDTGKTQYCFIEETGAVSITDYKGFREIIDRFDYPKK